MGQLDHARVSGALAVSPASQALDRKLVDVARGKIKRLMIFMPPSHGKSMLVLQFLPAWYLGTFPDRRIIVCGYGNDLAQCGR